ncbi:MAG: hypothetical protein QOK16_4198, partial [Solirubrobacteraceae bacterium]|nr:hypothetical protein [Solirubrobacteraceae bacterium]
ADLGSPVDALLAVLHPTVRITEHPNAITPRGAVRDRDAAVAGFLAWPPRRSTSTLPAEAAAAA